MHDGCMTDACLAVFSRPHLFRGSRHLQLSEHALECTLTWSDVQQMRASCMDEFLDVMWFLGLVAITVLPDKYKVLIFRGTLALRVILEL